jgi:glutamate N-acetyltransferase/amino-acid N-acetyltransferase
MIQDWKQNNQAGVTHPEGFVAAGVRCGLKREGNDLALIACERAANVAGTFTTNRVQASCVRYSSGIVKVGQARAILCNAGNANACNGERGDRDNLRMAEIAARCLGISPGEVLVASTGVIGHLLPMEKLEVGIPEVVARLTRSPATDWEVACAIMTTDTRPKSLAVTVESDQWSGPLRIGGACKGAGMIAPNMATMLCFLTTDAQIPASLLQKALSDVVGRTFNRLTVDGDTSTNDMVLLLASGSGPGRIVNEGLAFEDFREALDRVCRHLAREIARDGEGATKLVEITVRGAPSEEDAAKIAKTIAESPLVKTALYGSDPNWGRILAAAGRSGVDFDPDRAVLRLGEICVFRNGMGVSFDAKAAHTYLSSPEVAILLDLYSGSTEATVWTCDFSYEYVKINAEYHT